jgi:dUTP pyrophosphatase
MENVLLQKLTDDAVIPTYAHAGDAGADLTSTKNYVINPGEVVLISTGIAIALRNGYAAFVHPRSSLAVKSTVTVINTPGTIDAQYRGEIKVPLINHGTTPFKVTKGDRIAQLIIQKVEHADFIEVDELPQTERAAGGFGSTGK